VVDDLRLPCLTQLLGEMGPPEPNPIEVSPIETTPSSKDYDSLQLIACIIEDNKVSPDLEDLCTRVTTGKDNVWTLRDSMLLWYNKLYVTDGEVVKDMPLQTAIIREAYDQPLTGHPGISKLKRAIYDCYYWLSQGSDID
jgi:hypothetical protein